MIKGKNRDITKFQSEQISSENVSVIRPKARSFPIVFKIKWSLLYQLWISPPKSYLCDGERWTFFSTCGRPQAGLTQYNCTSEKVIHFLVNMYKAPSAYSSTLTMSMF